MFNLLKSIADGFFLLCEIANMEIYNIMNKTYNSIENEFFFFEYF